MSIIIVENRKGLMTNWFALKNFDDVEWKHSIGGKIRNVLIPNLNQWKRVNQFIYPPNENENWSVIDS